MQNIKIIIGASYGDEGKGLATDFFGAGAAGFTAVSTSKTPAVISDTINVLTNGGPQRGHTVELADGRRHVFKHFGAATFRGAETYFGGQFMVNPMEFVREFEELRGLDAAPIACMDPHCRFTTPWDMLTNQLQQEKRSDGLHNSCGFGIWETVLRYQRGHGIAFGAFIALSRDDRIAYLRGLRDGYCTARLREVGLDGSAASGKCLAQSVDHAAGRKCDDGLTGYFFSDDLLFRFEEDCETMRYLCPMRRDDHLRNYQTVLFENAQGLLLDGNAEKEKDFTTPSTTGVGKVFGTVERLFRGADVEVCYVTRSYLTRHGDGSMENELTGAELAGKMPGVRADLTNVENRFQGNLRYGMMDVDSLAARILDDFARCDAGDEVRGGRQLVSGASGNIYRPSLMVTHLNEFAGVDLDGLGQYFETMYLSDGRTGRDVARSLGRIQN